MGAGDVDQVIAQSTIVRTASRSIEILHVAARSSKVAAGVASVRRELLGLRPAQRIRLAGLLIAIALTTEQLLLTLIPAQLRPASPAALRIEVALAALMLILAAPQLARAWPTSRLRRALALLR